MSLTLLRLSDIFDTIPHVQNHVCIPMNIQVSQDSAETNLRRDYIDFITAFRAVSLKMQE